MAGAGRNMQGLLRRVLASAEASSVRGFAAPAESKSLTPEGRFLPGIFSRTKPLDRSTEWVAKNPYIEAWYYRRDHFEQEFTWNYRNTVEAVWFLGGFTFAAYYLSLFAFRQADRRSGYPTRSVVGDEPGPVLVDEREFY